MKIRKEIQWIVLLLPFSATAEVVLDGTQGGTAGQQVALDGNNTYQIDADTMANTTAGTNAFFSFSDFNVESGNTANFTATGSYDNVLARVTGGDPSVINGSITSDIAGANLWLINPHGVLFGQGSSVELTGSFHVGSADYVGLPGGIKYHTDVAQPFVAVAGNPLSLGVDPGSVSAQGNVELTGANISVANGEAISLVGSDVLIDGSYLQATDGQVQLLAISDSGEVLYSDNVYQSSSAAQYGRVELISSVPNVGEKGSVTVVADEQLRVDLDQHHDDRKRMVAAAETTQLNETDVTCQPRVFTGGVPMEFEVQEKEEGKHYFVRLSSSVGKAGINNLQDCVQP